MKSKKGAILFAGLAVVGVIGTAIMSAINTTKANEKLQVKEAEQGELDIKEKVMEVWKDYIPTAVVGAATVGCIIFSHRISQKQIAALSAACVTAGQKYAHFRDKVKEELGEEALEKVDESIAVEDAKTGLFDLTDGETLFYDCYSQRFFRSTESDVKNAEYHLNRNLQLSGEVPASMWADFLGLEQNDPIDDEVGWDACWLADMCDVIWIDFYHNNKHLPDGTPYTEISIDQPVNPTYEGPNLRYFYGSSW